MAFGNSSDLVVKSFKYDSEITDLSGLGLDPEMIKYLLKMFHDAAVAQQNAKNDPPADNDDNPFGPGRNWWEDSEGGVYCRWGALP